LLFRAGNVPFPPHPASRGTDAAPARHRRARGVGDAACGRPTRSPPPTVGRDAPAHRRCRRDDVDCRRRDLAILDVDAAAPARPRAGARASRTVFRTRALLRRASSRRDGRRRRTVL